MEEVALAQDPKEREGDHKAGVQERQRGQCPRQREEGRGHGSRRGTPGGPCAQLREQMWEWRLGHGGFREPSLGPLGVTLQGMEDTKGY